MSELKESQIKAALLLAEGRRCRDVAAEVGVSPETISHWRSQPAFKAYSKQLREELFKAGFDRLQLGIGLAAQELVHLASNGESESIRLRACRDLLSMFCRKPDIFYGS